MHDRHAAGAQLLLEPEVEVRRIDADEHGGPLLAQPSLPACAQPQQPRQVAQHLDVAAHRQFAHVRPGVEAGGDHAVAADTGAAQVRCAPAQFRNHSGREQVTRGLPGDEGAGAWLRHQRMMPRCEFRTKSLSRPMAPADAGLSATSVVERVDSLGGRQSVPVERLVGAPQQVDRVRVEAAALQALGVDAMRLDRIAVADHVGRNVAQHDRAAAGHRVRPHRTELVDRRQAADDRPVAQRDVAGQRRVVGEDRVVADADSRARCAHTP